MKDRRVFSYKVEDNVLEVFCIGKWRPMAYVAWNNNCRKGKLSGKTRARVERVLILNQVMGQDEVVRFEMKE